MEQLSSSIKVMEAANHSKNSAMEAENHVNNGASSKSLTSRVNFKIYRNFMLIILAISVILSGCSKKDKEEEEEKNGIITPNEWLIEGQKLKSEALRQFYYKSFRTFPNVICAMVVFEIEGNFNFFVRLPSDIQKLPSGNFSMSGKDEPLTIVYAEFYKKGGGTSTAIEFSSLEVSVAYSSSDNHYTINVNGLSKNGSPIKGNYTGVNSGVFLMN